MIENHWPFRVVWAKERGWLEVEDPWTGDWFEIPARGAPHGWVRIAVEAAVPKNTLSRARTNEINESDLYSRTLPKNTLRRVRIHEMNEPNLYSRTLP
jgi:hypothetical protein